MVLGRQLFRVCFLAITALVAGVATVPHAHANPKYAAFVMHSDTGDVLFDRYADEKRYPASLTKMMTLYMLFEAIEAGDVSLDDKLKVSKRASLQPASRLGLKRGSTIEVETAIEALVIRSANDVATVVAEKLGGSEAAFARKMTAKARDLGMKRTTFRNASGLPDRRQVTTARDMAILSQRLVQDFPDYFHYFDQSTFRWNGRTYTSHNKVARTMDGADGLKTGYTRASGYNLSTTIERGDNRLIGIVLGGRSARSRDRHMTDILNEAYKDIRRKPSLISAIHRVKPIPSLRPDRSTPSSASTVLASAVPVPRPKPSGDDEAPLNFDQLQLAINDVAANKTNLDIAPVGEGDAEIREARDWVIQVGAFTEQPQAIAKIRQTQQKVQLIAPSAGREVNIAEKGATTFYRARFNKLTEGEALESCSLLKANGSECIALSIAR